MLKESVFFTITDFWHLLTAKLKEFLILGDALVAH